MNQDFFNFLFCEIKIWGEKKIQKVSKISKICTRKTHFSPKEDVEFLEFFIGSSFFKWGHIFLLAFLVTCTLSMSLSRTLTHFNSLFGQVSQVSTLFWEISHLSILSFDKSHTFQCEYWIACNEFLLIRSTSNLSNKELGSQMHNMFCTKFQKHKHHKLQWGPIIERSNELC